MGARLPLPHQQRHILIHFRMVAQVFNDIRPKRPDIGETPGVDVGSILISESLVGLAQLFLLGIDVRDERINPSERAYFVVSEEPNLYRTRSSSNVAAVREVSRAMKRAGCLRVTTSVAYATNKTSDTPTASKKGTA